MMTDMMLGLVAAVMVAWVLGRVVNRMTDSTPHWMQWYSGDPHRLKSVCSDITAIGGVRAYLSEGLPEPREPAATNAQAEEDTDAFADMMCSSMKLYVLPPTGETPYPIGATPVNIAHAAYLENEVMLEASEDIIGAMPLMLVFLRHAGGGLTVWRYMNSCTYRRDIGVAPVMRWNRIDVGEHHGGLLSLAMHMADGETGASFGLGLDVNLTTTDPDYRYPMGGTVSARSHGVETRHNPVVCQIDPANMIFAANLQPVANNAEAKAEPETSTALSSRRIMDLD